MPAAEQQNKPTLEKKYGTIGDEQLKSTGGAAAGALSGTFSHD